MLKHLLTWWNGCTLGTLVFTRRYGALVGRDAFGNRYFQTADHKRRWVIYHAGVDASQIGAQWHGWLHHTYDQSPTTAPLPRQAWEKPHIENLTGTKQAYHPPGSLLAPISAPLEHYTPWKPE